MHYEKVFWRAINERNNMARWVIPERKEDQTIKKVMQYVELCIRDVNKIKDCRFSNEQKNIAISVETKLERIVDILKNDT